VHFQSTIYLLEDPRDGLIRYVGSTVKPLVARVSGHVSTARAGVQTPVAAWVRDLLLVGLRPQGFVIDRVPAHLAASAEDFWRTYYEEFDAPLLNINTRRASLMTYLHWRQNTPLDRTPPS
jgi:hypothetical protein